MMAKPMKTLELYYPKIQFLIMNDASLLSEMQLSNEAIVCWCLVPVKLFTFSCVNCIKILQCRVTVELMKDAYVAGNISIVE